MTKILEYIEQELSEVVLGRSEYEDGYIAALNIMKRFVEGVLKDENKDLHKV